MAGTIIFGNRVSSMTDFLYSGVFLRYPNLKLLYAEAQIGWIPYLLERIDDVWETHRGWSHSHEYTNEKPSAMYHDHVFSTFFKDPVGIRLLDQIGEDNVIFESDYPHQDGTWPYTREQAARAVRPSRPGRHRQDRPGERPAPARPGRAEAARGPFGG